VKGVHWAAVYAGLALSALLLLAEPNDAFGLDTNFAGSAQIDYHLVPTSKDANARSIAFDGFTLEAAVKVTADLSDALSANVKACYGCHGFEMDMAYFDLRIADELALRLGRFSPSFGNFNIRHDPANHRLSDKPLPYDMGRMLRLREWNMGVLPSPFPDNGLEISGHLAFGEGVWTDYAVYAVSGFKGDTNSPDLDFAQSRDGNAYYIDNNGRPSVGARMLVTARLGATSDVTLGGSVMHGTFEPTNEFHYTIVGGDLVFRFGTTNVRFEYLARRQEYDTSDPTRFRYPLFPNENFFVKHGAYAEIEQPVSAATDFMLRVDGMARIGDVAALPLGAPAPADGQLGRRSWVVRATAGAAISIQRNLRLKASTELWDFSEPDQANKTLAVSAHLGAVGTF
jgi:hypothetical protein